MSMNIRVRSIAIGDYIPRKFTVEIPKGMTVRSLIDYLSLHLNEKFREDILLNGEIAPEILILLNGVSLCQPETGLDLVLHDGDEVIFSVMVYGG